MGIPRVGSLTFLYVGWHAKWSAYESMVEIDLQSCSYIRFVNSLDKTLEG